MMRCGNCKQQHANADEVRACYQRAGKIRDQFLPDGPVSSSAKQGPVNPASEAQGRYIVSLQEERVLPEDWLRFDYDRDLPFLEKADANSKINALKAMPKKDWGTNGHFPTKWTMPAGRYAIHDGTQWKFWEVSHGKDGTRWQGYTFVVMLVGAPGTYRKIRVNKADAQGVLKYIEAHQDEAMTDYGLQSGVCGRCASPLTDPQSLARGIGPVCLSKLGW